MTDGAVTYPYLPEGRAILYVSEYNRGMILAQLVAKKKSLDKAMPTGSVLIKHGVFIGEGANGSDYHDLYGCERKKRGSKTGEDYELCEGCHPKNHSEAKAIADAREKGHDPNGADLYLWGHWWCCKDCWDAIIEAGIRNVYLVKKSEVFFNKDHPNNVIGKYFL